MHMTPEQWRAIRPILESALELDPEKRDRFLDAACVDQSIRREVDSLLQAHDEAGTNELQVAAALRVESEAEARFRVPIGARIGAYRILDEIAEGGMGAVYRARRDDGNYQQEVAVKIVRTELGGEVGSARFRNERQILATLDHPNIARILDGGATSEGIPYLVMELIDGLPITEYCDQHRLSIAERVNLFRSVCSAVQFAHQHLVIHRDIKPSNILVNAQGVPKLLDFGIAKILDPRAMTAGKDLTLAGALLLTPDYASPEQIKGQPMTTATDVYSLGCVLYELLTGHRVLQLTDRTPHQIARAILESEPEKPSTLVRRAAARAAATQAGAPLTEMGQLRRETPRRLQRRLKGDLDNIVMRAIRKVPAARYESVDQYSEDLRRHLNAEPVRARRNTLGYRAGRLIARHKVAVVASAAVVLALAGGLIGTIYQARVARANELRAERRFNEVRKLAHSLIFEIHDSIEPLAGATKARGLIIQDAQTYLESLARESGDDPTLMRELAVAHMKLGNIQGPGNDAKIANTGAALANYQKAVSLLESAAALQPADLETRHQLGLGYHRLAAALDVTGDKAGRDRYVQKAVQILESLALSRPEDADVQYDLGIAYGRAARFLRGDGDGAHATEYYRKARAIYGRLHARYPDSRKYARELSHSNRHIGTFLAFQKQFDEALTYYRAAAEIDAQQLALDPTGRDARFNSALSGSAIAFVLGEQGDVEGAIHYYREALGIRRALLAADPQDNGARTAIADTLVYLGVNLVRQKDYAAALDSYREALATWDASKQRDPENKEYVFQIAWTQADIGQAYAAMAFDTQASNEQRASYCRESLGWYQRALPVWLEGQTEVKLGVGGAEALSGLKRNIAECEQVAGKPLQHTARR